MGIQKRDRLTIKTKDDRITISFNSAGWNPVHAKLLEFVWSDRDMPVAEFIGKAIEFYARAKDEGSEGSFDRFMEMLQVEVRKDEDRAAGKPNVPPSIRFR